MKRRLMSLLSGKPNRRKHKFLKWEQKQGEGEKNVFKGMRLGKIKS